MKRLFFVLGLLTVLFTNSSLATNDNSYPAFLKSFFKTFTKAEKVSWTEVEGMIRISFMEEGKESHAYYNAAGFLIVATRPLVVSELPASLQSQLTKQFSTYSVSEVFEFKKDKSTEYYVVLGKGEKQVVLKSTGKKWSRFSSSSK